MIDHIIRARCASVFAKALTRQAAQSRTAPQAVSSTSGIYDKRVPSFAVAVTPGREVVKCQGWQHWKGSETNKMPPATETGADD